MSKDKPVEEVPLSGSSRPTQEPMEGVTGAAADTDFEQSPASSALKESLEGISDNTEIVDRIISAPRDQVLPWEDCELPSKGLYYGWNSSIVQVHPWGANVDKILATQRLAQTGQSINYLVRECCKFPDGFDTTELLVGDQVFLLYYLRGIIYGHIYEFVLTCPNPQCRATSTHEANLNELAQTITWADQSLGAEPFSVRLPFLSKTAGRDMTVGIRFLRVADSQAISRNQQTIRRSVGGSGHARIIPRKKGGRPGVQQRPNDDNIALDDTLTKNIETVIVNIMDSVTDKTKIRQFVDRLHSSDLATIREWLTNNTPGIMTQVEVTCPECANEFRVMLPITEGFFRPEER